MLVSVVRGLCFFFFCFFFNDTATTEIYTLSLHDALPFSRRPVHTSAGPVPLTLSLGVAAEGGEIAGDTSNLLRAAGGALKRAQQSGKNRAALADESGLAIDAVPPEDGGSTS